MKQNLRCYTCVRCPMCDEELEEKCAKAYYAFFATKDDIRLCDMLCGEPQEDED